MEVELVQLSRQLDLGLPLHHLARICPLEASVPHSAREQLEADFSELLYPAQQQVLLEVFLEAPEPQVLEPQGQLQALEIQALNLAQLDLDQLLVRLELLVDFLAQLLRNLSPLSGLAQLALEAVFWAELQLPEVLAGLEVDSQVALKAQQA